MPTLSHVDLHRQSCLRIDPHLRRLRYRHSPHTPCCREPVHRLRARHLRRARSTSEANGSPQSLQFPLPHPPELSTRSHETLVCAVKSYSDHGCVALRVGRRRSVQVNHYARPVLGTLISSGGPKHPILHRVTVYADGCCALPLRRQQEPRPQTRTPPRRELWTSSPPRAARRFAGPGRPQYIGSTRSAAPRRPAGCGSAAVVVCTRNRRTLKPIAPATNPASSSAFAIGLSPTRTPFTIAISIPVRMSAASSRSVRTRATRNSGQRPRGLPALRLILRQKHLHVGIPAPHVHRQRTIAKHDSRAHAPGEGSGRLFGRGPAQQRAVWIRRVRCRQDHHLTLLRLPLSA